MFRRCAIVSVAVAGHYTYVSGFLAKDIYVNDSLLVLAEPGLVCGPEDQQAARFAAVQCCGATYPGNFAAAAGWDVL
jgi:hypothetical protein